MLWQLSFLRVYQQLRLVEDQISALATEKREQLKQVDNAKMRQVAQLLRLPGIGPVSSWTFVMEFFGWRQFRNRREVAALAGLTPTPYDSGRRLREQGISKAGNRRSSHSGHRDRLGLAAVSTSQQVEPMVPGTVCRRGSRMRRIGIVALARRLLIDLWRFLEYGVVPEGAQVRPLAV